VAKTRSSSPWVEAKLKKSIETWTDSCHIEFQNYCRFQIYDLGRLQGIIVVDWSLQIGRCDLQADLQ